AVVVAPVGLVVKADPAICCVLFGLTERFGSLSWPVSALCARGIMLTTTTAGTGQVPQSAGQLEQVSGGTAVVAQIPLPQTSKARASCTPKARNPAAMTVAGSRVL